MVVQRHRAGGRTVYNPRFKDPKGEWTEANEGITSRREAEARERELKGQVEAGTYIEKDITPAITLAGWFRIWISRRVNKTKEHDRQRMEHYVLPKLGQRKMLELHKRDCIAFVRSLVAQKVNPKTIANIWGALRVCLRDAEIDGIIDWQPAMPEGVIPSKQSPIQTIYSNQDVEELTRDAGTNAMAFFGLVAFFTGMRQGEICGLRWSDYEPATPDGNLGSLLVCRQYDGVGDNAETKTQRPRLVPVHPLLAAALDVYAAQRLSDEAPIVPLHSGDHHTKSTSYKAWRRHCAAHGVTCLGVHRTRHTAVTAMRRGGGNSHDVSLVTHNASGNIVDRYTHDWGLLCSVVLGIDYSRRVASRVSLPKMPLELVEARGIETRSDSGTSEHTRENSEQPAAELPVTCPQTIESATAREVGRETCPLSRRVDGPRHSWVFDGDDPYVICAYCDEMRDALTGRVIRQGMGAQIPDRDRSEMVGSDALPPETIATSGSGATGETHPDGQQAARETVTATGGDSLGAADGPKTSSSAVSELRETATAAEKAENQCKSQRINPRSTSSNSSPTRICRHTCRRLARRSENSPARFLNCHATQSEQWRCASCSKPKTPQCARSSRGELCESRSLFATTASDRFAMACTTSAIVSTTETPSQSGWTSVVPAKKSHSRQLRDHSAGSTSSGSLRASSADPKDSNQKQDSTSRQRCIGGEPSRCSARSAAQRVPGATDGHVAVTETRAHDPRWTRTGGNQLPAIEAEKAGAYGILGNGWSSRRWTLGSSDGDRCDQWITLVDPDGSMVAPCVFCGEPLLIDAPHCEGCHHPHDCDDSECDAPACIEAHGEEVSLAGLAHCAVSLGLPLGSYPNIGALAALEGGAL